MLAFRILGVKGNKAEEMEKAGVVVKTIRIGKNGATDEEVMEAARLANCEEFVNLLPDTKPPQLYSQSPSW